MQPDCLCQWKHWFTIDLQRLQVLFVVKPQNGKQAARYYYCKQGRSEIVYLQRGATNVLWEIYDDCRNMLKVCNHFLTCHIYSSTSFVVRKSPRTGLLMPMVPTKILDIMVESTVHKSGIKGTAMLFIWPLWVIYREWSSSKLVQNFYPPLALVR